MLFFLSETSSRENGGSMFTCYKSVKTEKRSGELPQAPVKVLFCWEVIRSRHARSKENKVEASFPQKRRKNGDFHVLWDVVYAYHFPPTSAWRGVVTHPLSSPAPHLHRENSENSTIFNRRSENIIQNLLFHKTALSQYTYSRNSTAAHIPYTKWQNWPRCSYKAGWPFFALRWVLGSGADFGGFFVFVRPRRPQGPRAHWMPGGAALGRRSRLWRATVPGRCTSPRAAGGCRCARTSSKSSSWTSMHPTIQVVSSSRFPSHYKGTTLSLEVGFSHRICVMWFDVMN